MTEKKLAYEDFEEGLTLPLGNKQVTAAEIVEFASEFDPQPFHLDEKAGKNSMLGGLAASGWHTCSMFMRMMHDSWLHDSTSQGAPGMDRVRWLKPVLAGDTLTGSSTVLNKRVSKTRPHLGLVSFRQELRNQKDEQVFEAEHSIMFLRRSQS